MRLALAVAVLLLLPVTAEAKPLVPVPPDVYYMRLADAPADWAYSTGDDFVAGSAQDTIYYVGHLASDDRAHELGHVFDYELLTDRARDRFKRLLHLRGPWVVGVDDGMSTSPDECFADWYMNARLGLGPQRTYGSWEGGYDCPSPTVRSFARFVRAVKRLYRRIPIN